MKKILAMVLALVAALTLCACGSIYDKEYVVIDDYTLPAGSAQTGGDQVSVSTAAALKSELQSMVYSGKTEGTIVFSSDYTGTVADDLSNAVWQLRTRNAICAYCVENISYELNRVVTYDEAQLHISYSAYAVPIDEIVRLTYFTGVEDLLLSSLSSGQERLVICIGNSNYTAADMETLAESIYRENPALVPAEPEISVELYSGNGLQKLYEITFSYRISSDTFSERMEELNSFEPFGGDELNDISGLQGALLACKYLTQHTALSQNGSDNSVYSVLITGAGDSEGLALTYEYLCKQLGISCTVVYGQKDRAAHCWNIITLDGDSYHVDVSACIEENSLAAGFLKRDTDIWSVYRWDTTSYPSCEGTETYENLAGIAVRSAAAETEATPEPTAEP